MSQSHTPAPGAPQRFDAFGFCNHREHFGESLSLWQLDSAEVGQLTRRETGEHQELALLAVRSRVRR